MTSSLLDSPSLASICYFGNRLWSSRVLLETGIAAKTQHQWHGRSHQHLSLQEITVTCTLQQQKQQVLVVVGGGAAGVFGAIRVKTLCPHMEVLVFERGQALSKVRISGGGRCNVTTGLVMDPPILSGHYPRGHKELRGSFFWDHGPRDTAVWFTERGVPLKTEEDGRMFPESDDSATIVNCLLNEAHCKGVLLHTGASVTSVSFQSGNGFNVQIGRPDKTKRDIQANYVLLATGGSRQGYKLATQLGHTLIDPRPSLFTFKVADVQLKGLAGISFPEVRAELEILHEKRKNPNLTQVGPMLVTHWGLSGPVILRLSAWAARELFASKYQGTLWMDFLPMLNPEEAVKRLVEHKQHAGNRKVGGGPPAKFPLVRRFWCYLLSRMGINVNFIWATLSNSTLRQLVSLIKRCPFLLSGKGDFKDEFVTAGGVPLAEVNLKTMESRICPHLYFAGEVLNIDGVTGGFNFQNAWTGGYIAGTSIASKAATNDITEDF